MTTCNKAVEEIYQYLTKNRKYADYKKLKIAHGKYDDLLEIGYQLKKVKDLLSKLDKKEAIKEIERVSDDLAINLTEASIEFWGMVDKLEEEMRAFNTRAEIMNDIYGKDYQHLAKEAIDGA